MISDLARLHAVMSVGHAEVVWVVPERAASGMVVVVVVVVLRQWLLSMAGR